MISYFCPVKNDCEHIDVKQILSKILTCFVLLIYLIGLSNFLLSRLIHETHHILSHTLSQHHGHSNSGYNNHGHSHNSFIDYSLFIEENTKKSENTTESTPVVEVDYNNHLVSGNNFIDNLLFNISDNRFITIEIVVEESSKPPYPPPEYIS